jgi:putative flippase GtrA
LRFGAVGGAANVLYLGLYAAQLAAGVPYLLASAAGCALAATVSYWLNEHWTFGGRRPSAGAWLAWLGAQGGATVVNLVLLAAAVDGLGLGALIAQVILLPVTPLATYLIGRRWVFSRAAAPPAGTPPPAGRDRS